MRTILIAYIATAVCFFALDMVWLGNMTSGFYRPRLGAFMREKPDLVVAGLFYALYVVGIVAFVVLPAVRSGGWTAAVTSGALFGLVAFATYDMTNLSTMRGFPASVAVVDMIWGTVATAVASTLATLATSYMARGL